MDLAGWWAAGNLPSDGPKAAVPASDAGLTSPPRARRRAWSSVAHLWAVVKMAFMVYGTQWAMSAAHAHLAGQLTAYGAMCLFAGFGARWRRRFFGPGQILEPELYEELGRWLYRLGTVLVLCGGALALA